MKKGVVFGVLLVAVFVVGYAILSASGPGEGPRAGVRDITGNVVNVDNGGASVREEIPVYKAGSEVVFTGYAPGKLHDVRFAEWDGTLTLEDGEVVGFKGEIMADSLYTGIDGLDADLKSERFLDVEHYPVISFETTSVKDSRIMEGVLTFKGVTKEVSFPVNINGRDMNAEFFLDVTEFDLEHSLIDPEIKVFFDIEGQS